MDTTTKSLSAMYTTAGAQGMDGGQNLFNFIFTTLAWFTVSQIYSLTADVNGRQQRSLTISEAADDVLEAIRAFEHRLYVERSGSAAFELISPTAPPFTTVENLDIGIAETPVGSKYCLDLDPVLPGLFTLTVSLVQPDGTPGPKYRTQRVTTSVVDGRHLIESITEVGE